MPTRVPQELRIATVVKERGGKCILDKFGAGGGSRSENGLMPHPNHGTRRLSIADWFVQLAPDGKFLMPAAFQDGVAAVKQDGGKAVEFVYR